MVSKLPKNKTINQVNTTFTCRNRKYWNSKSVVINIVTVMANPYAASICAEVLKKKTIPTQAIHKIPFTAGTYICPC